MKFFSFQNVYCQCSEVFLRTYGCTERVGIHDYYQWSQKAYTFCTVSDHCATHYSDPNHFQAHHRLEIPGKQKLVQVLACRGTPFETLFSTAIEVLLNSGQIRQRKHWQFKYIERQTRFDWSRTGGYVTDQLYSAFLFLQRFRSS